MPKPASKLANSQTSRLRAQFRRRHKSNWKRTERPALFLIVSPGRPRATYISPRILWFTEYICRPSLYGLVPTFEISWNIWTTCMNSNQIQTQTKTFPPLQRLRGFQEWFHVGLYKKFESILNLTINPQNAPIIEVTYIYVKHAV